MKWTPKQRKKKIMSSWHEWFAWHPIKFDGSWYWLETVCRKQIQHSEYGFMDRLFCIPDYTYKETIFDIIKDNEDLDDNMKGVRIVIDSNGNISK